MHCNEEESPLATTRESPRSSNEDPAQPQANKENYLKKNKTHSEFFGKALDLT